MSTPERGGQRPRTEAERAAYYDTHHAEVEAWPEVPPPSGAKEAKQRGVIMSARFTMSEAAALERAARARGVTVSAFLRAAAQEAADVAPPPVDASRIADRLIALADELRPSSPSRRSQAGTTDRRTTTKAAITSSQVLRDARTSKSPKTAAARALSERTKKKTG